MKGLTVAELRERLREMPQDVTVFFPDSQHGDQLVLKVEDTVTYTDGARIVRIS